MGYIHSEKKWTKTWRPLSIIGFKYFHDEDGHLYRKVGNKLKRVNK
ncbi:hypothetical protein MM326_18465 [Alkalihalobacillus sp. LMS6]|nr:MULTISPECIES: hypothetical protein [Bacillaceae]UTR06037.1 hypothetical protein MM326_18465 [Alkalihalobacillus sp. LMS6]